MAGYILNDEKEKPETKNILPSKAVIQIQQKNHKLCRQAKAKKIQHHKTSFTTNAKGNFLCGKEKSTTRNKKIMN